MKALSTAETKFVSGGIVRTWPAPFRTGLPGTVAEAAPAVQVTSGGDDAQRRMAPALASVDHFRPPTRFDAARMAPGDTDDDTYNGFNDQGSGV